ncbi:unnamed protein product [Bubo scandiacus]
MGNLTLLGTNQSDVVDKMTAAAGSCPGNQCDFSATLLLKALLVGGGCLVLGGSGAGARGPQPGSDTFPAQPLLPVPKGRRRGEEGWSWLPHHDALSRWL